MRSCLLFYLLFSGAALQAQEKEIYYNYNWEEISDAGRAAFVSFIKKTGGGWARGDFYANTTTPKMTGFYSDEACTIQNGAFIWYYPGNKVQKQGSYKNGQKQGLWLEFYPNGNLMDSLVYNNGVLTNYGLKWHSNGMMRDSSVAVNDSATECFRWFDNGYPAETGMLINGKEQGIWQFMYRNGKLAAQVDFDTGAVVQAVYYDSTGLRMPEPAVAIKEAVFGKGEKSWRKYLEDKVFWPSGFTFGNADTAVVVVNFTISGDGAVEDAYVSVPVHTAFDNIALNVVKKSPRWQPGIYFNRPVRTWHIQAIQFIQQ